jgi:hypothetical protein
MLFGWSWLMNGKFTQKKQNQRLVKAYSKMNEEGRKVLDVVIKKLAEAQYSFGIETVEKYDVENEA